MRGLLEPPVLPIGDPSCRLVRFPSVRLSGWLDGFRERRFVFPVRPMFRGGARRAVESLETESPLLARRLRGVDCRWGVGLDKKMGRRGGPRLPTSSPCVKLPVSTWTLTW